ncbi:MAG: hypothetical protein WCJ09_19635 [Planctomycetota bacterium]
MRSQTTITAVRSLLFGMLTLISTAAWAEPDSVADATRPEVPRFFVWQGSCSRSLKITGSYFDEKSALSSLYRAKPQGEIFITEGKEYGLALAVLVYRRSAENNPELECTVYGRACRSMSWFALSPESTLDLKTAKELLTANTTSLPIYRKRSVTPEKS